MELMALITLAAASLITALGCFARSTRRTIIFLSMQAIAIGTVELVHCLINLIVGLNIEALVYFFITFAEWFLAAAVIPLILYWGVTKTENILDEPIIGIRRLILFASLITPLYVGLWLFQSPALQGKMASLPFCMLMFSLSIFLISTRNDSLKILVGLNMAENALYPLLAESPITLIPFILALMIFVTAMGTYIVVEAYRDYGTISVNRWRWLNK